MRSRLSACVDDIEAFALSITVLILPGLPPFPGDGVPSCGEPSAASLALFSSVSFFAAFFAFFHFSLAVAVLSAASF